MTLVTRRNHYIYQLHVNFLSVLGRFCRRPGELDKTTATGSFSETSQDNISDFWNILRNYRINYRLNQVGDWYHNKSLYIQYIYICDYMRNETHPSYKAPKRDSQSPFSPGFWHWISHQLWNLRSWQLAKTAVRRRGALQMWKVVRLRDLSLTKTSGSQETLGENPRF